MSASKKNCQPAREADTIKSFDEITEGKADDLPEQAFLYLGTIDEVRQRAKELAAA